jgi:hypothetical protein
MEINLPERIPNNLSVENMELLEQEIFKADSFILLKKKEFFLLKILKILENNCLNSDVSISIEIENNSCYFSISIEADINQTEESISEIIWELDDVVKNEIYSRYNYLSFINNEVGRDKLLEFFLGNNWEIWKQEGVVLERYNKINAELNEQTIINTHKLKL